MRCVTIKYSLMGRHDYLYAGRGACDIALAIAAAMEGKPMFAKSVTELTNYIHRNIHKTPQQVHSKAQAFGLPIRPQFSKERVIFIFAQTLITLLDEPEPNQDSTLPSPEGIGQVIPQHSNIEGNSTLKNNKATLSGNMHVAVLLLQTICPRLLIWDCVDALKAVGEQLKDEDSIREQVAMEEGKVVRLNNLKGKYYCHCMAEGRSHPRHSVQCQQCLAEYHPECQANVVYCNSCLLMFYLQDLSEEINDPFGTHKTIEEGFFSYLETPPVQDAEQVYFQMASFSFPELVQQADRRQQHLVVKLCAVDHIFSQEVEVGSGQRGKAKDCDFWECNGIQHSFFLNHNQLKIPPSISKNCLLLKVPLRLLAQQNNILIVRCLKRSQRFRPKPPQSLSYWPQQVKSKRLMLGIYHIDRSPSKRRALSSSSLLGQAMGYITMEQSFYHLQYVLKKVNRIECQWVDLLDPTSREKILNPVRSYGCDHLECFDYETLRRNMAQSKLPPKRKVIRKVAPLDLHSGVIELDSEPQQMECEEPQQEQSESRRRKGTGKQGQDKPILNCPLCGRRLLALYQDPLFVEILRYSGFNRRVKMDSQGRYAFEEPCPVLLD